MARRGTLWGSLGEISSREQGLQEGLSADGVLYFSTSDDATLLPDFYGTGLGLQPWPMVPAGFGTYAAPSPDVLMSASWAAPDLVAQGQDAGAPMPQGAEGPAMTIQGTPNDSRYTDGSLWGMYGDASSPGNEFGSQAAEAWAQGHTGSMANVIGVIDSGIDYTHPDLYLNIWLNQREIPTTLRTSLSDTDSDGLITFRDLNGSANAAYVLDYNSDGRIDAGDLLNDIRWENGVDEDGNGYLDDLIGWDFANNDNDPMDGNGHGTHVSGTIGAIGGNGIGVAGVNWNVQLIALNIVASGGLGNNSVRIQAIDYFTNMATSARAADSAENFLATSNSWGGSSYSQGVLDAITRAAQQDILFIAGAGNNGTNNDNSPFYPSQYATVPVTGHEAVISVAAITSTGSLWSGSNFGMTSVDIAAPGSEIWSTLPNGQYVSWNGTSMATPHVTGAVALYASLFPNATSAQIREALLSSAILTGSINDLVSSDGRLSIPAMLAVAPPVTEFADWLDGTSSAESLNGLGGNDTLDGGLGADSLIGGAGNDLVSYAEATGAVTVSLAGNLASGAAGNDSLSGFENALGGKGADSVLGDAFANSLTGGPGHDTLDGAIGLDTLLGSDGQDSLTGGTENEACFFLLGQPNLLLSVNIILGNPSFPFDWTASVPAFTDLDKDGDQDLVVGRSDGGFSVFLRNQNGEFVAATSNWGLPPSLLPFTFPPSGAYNSAPSFVDLDSDGDLDAVIGRSDGTLSAFRLDTIFVAMDGQNGRPLNPFLGIDIGALSKPTFADLDLDGDADLVIGNQEGTLSAFLRNANGSYSQMDGLNGRPVNPFLGIDVGSLSAPVFADLDLDGDQDLVVGSEAGTLAAFRRGADGIFSPMDGVSGRPANPFDGIDIGSSSAPSFTNLNGDSMLDLVIGSASRTLTTYFAQSDNDRLDGGNGADTLDGATGADTLVGGAGNDLFIISDTLDQIFEAVGGGADTIIASVSMTIPNHIEALRIATDVSGVTLIGGAGNDVLIGNGLANNFNGGAGDDVILVGNATVADIYALFAT